MSFSGFGEAAHFNCDETTAQPVHGNLWDDMTMQTVGMTC